jgi:hypothetical protein
MFYAVLSVANCDWALLSIWYAIPTIFLFDFLRSLLSRNITHAAGSLVLPIAAILLFQTGTETAADIRFRVNKSSYERVVADAMAGHCSDDDRQKWSVPIDGIDCHAPPLIVFIWFGMGSLWSGVIYDAADQITQSPAARSDTWKHGPVGIQLSCSEAVKDLGNHFYFAQGNYSSGPHDCE